MIGSHFYKCYKQCGLPEVDDDNQSHCIIDDCEDQTGSRFYGKCLLFSSGPEHFDRNQTAFNHLHILIRVPTASKRAWGFLRQLGFGKGFKYGAQVLRFKNRETGQLDAQERRRRWFAASSRLQALTKKCFFSVRSRYMPPSLRIKVL